ncbi:hypothetical protein BpHYR1_050230 [Brachionus plicatilis]|uniref:Uncharacterized protein n=1 Tax=Brachionus plicatilis TaxID=10195 RepID=A0A3M7RK49_BRAPC|nr:hypothetical protein BpHYR1_050230 [Brachionus plicatilis]
MEQRIYDDLVLAAFLNPPYKKFFDSTESNKSLFIEKLKDNLGKKICRNRFREIYCISSSRDGEKNSCGNGNGKINGDLENNGDINGELRRIGDINGDNKYSGEINQREQPKLNN